MLNTTPNNAPGLATQTDPNQPKPTQTQSDRVEPSQTGSDPVRLPDWITLEEVERRFAEQGLVRTRTLLARYCRQRRLVGTKDAGPNGDEWYVDPTSIPRAVTELKMIQRDRPSQTESNPVRLQFSGNQASETSETPQNSQNGAFSPENDTQTDPNQPKPSRTQSDSVRLGSTYSSGDIFEHVYVKQLQRKVETLETTLQETHTAHRKELMQLQERNTIALSNALSQNFFAQALSIFGGKTAGKSSISKVVPPSPEPEPIETDETQTQSDPVRPGSTD